MTKPMNFPRRKEQRLKAALNRRTKERAPIVEIEAIEANLKMTREKHFTKKLRT